MLSSTLIKTLKLFTDVEVKLAEVKGLGQNRNKLGEVVQDGKGK